MKNNPIFPIILCGGTGTRLWPLSRKSFPKQFLSLSDNEGKTLLQETQERIKNIKNIKDPILICNEDHRFIVAEQMRAINVTPQKILLEPFGRNTAPAITLGALLALEIEDNPNLLILSSDHYIKNQDNYIKAIKKGLEYSEEERLVTFGVLPTFPETGYGYIEAESKLNFSTNSGSNIKNFIEKPSPEKARKLYQNDFFAWNSGIFLFKAKTIIKEIQKFYPKLVDICKESLEGNSLDLDFQRLKKNTFEKCQNISIDIAVMEKTNIGTVVPLDIGWSDIGSWESLWENSKKDENGNVIKGKVILKGSSNSFFNSEERLLVGIGIKDLIAIETNDAVLVANKNKSQEVKEIVEILKERGISEGIEHKKMFRPWGYYVSLVQDSEWKVKLIYVKPKSKLSLQSHKYRAEHWINVNGNALVIIDDKKIPLKANQSVYIPKGIKHRLVNETIKPLQIIEVQTGSYLGEDDIERFEDNYGRTKNNQ